MNVEILKKRITNSIVGYDYREVVARFDDNGKIRDVTYYTRENGMEGMMTCVILYSHNEYLGKLNLRQYFMDQIPKKYKDIIETLKKFHKNTNWNEITN